MKRQTLKLTSEESDFLCWEEAYYKNNVRQDNRRAARYAWRRACVEFPRLMAFERPIP